MNDGNYIKIYRSFLEWEWYGNINTSRLFFHMLMKANWKDAKFQGTTVPRGSFISSVSRLAEETALTEREIRTAISHLKTTGEVTSKATNKYTVFTVVNYNLYQSSDTQNDNQETIKRHSNDILTTTIEEEKERKKEKREKEKKKGVTNVTRKKEPAPQVYYPNDEKLNRAFADYVQMRKLIKKPMTEEAVPLVMRKLQKLAALPFSETMDNDLAIQILEQSVMNSWQGLFPLKESGSPSQKREGSIYDEWRNA